MNNATWKQAFRYDKSSSVWSITSGNGAVVAVGESYEDGISYAMVWTSRDGGDTWTNPLKLPDLLFRKVVYGNGTFAVALSPSTYYTPDNVAYLSSDGLSWNTLARGYGRPSYETFWDLHYFPTGWMAGTSSPVDNYTLSNSWVLRPAYLPNSLVNGEVVSTSKTNPTNGRQQIWATPNPHLGTYYGNDQNLAVGGNLPPQWTLRYEFPSSWSYGQIGNLAYGQDTYAMATATGLLTSTSLSGTRTFIPWGNINDAWAGTGAGSYQQIYFYDNLWMAALPSLYAIAGGTRNRDCLLFAESLDGPWTRVELEDTTSTANAAYYSNDVSNIIFDDSTSSWYASGVDVSVYTGYATIWTNKPAAPHVSGAYWGIRL